MIFVLKSDSEKLNVQLVRRDKIIGREWFFAAFTRTVAESFCGEMAELIPLSTYQDPDFFHGWFKWFFSRKRQEEVKHEPILIHNGF